MSGYLRKMARNRMRANQGTMHRAVRTHEPVLRDIEGVFVHAYAVSPEVDDEVCHAALEALLTDQPARRPMAALLADRLKARRQAWRNVPEIEWQDCLRVVARSIRNHSARQSGEIGYLVFVSAFLP